MSTILLIITIACSTLAVLSCLTSKPEESKIELKEEEFTDFP
ncbi:hypothetical protein [Croceivirga radicis]|nr:hypothetical protein [Croceivirga radicis]